MDEPRGIETYAVGFFRDVGDLYRRVKHKQKELHPWKAFFYWFVRSWNRKNYWNGYLAEWHYPPDGVHIHMTGHGWTRKRALRRMGKYLVRDNLSPLEQKRRG